MDPANPGWHQSGLMLTHLSIGLQRT